MADYDKHVVSVSLGSSRRDHQVSQSFAGVCFRLERRGTNGDFEAAKQLFAKLDGKVDALGVGGIDLWLTGPKTRHKLPQAWELVEGIHATPYFDGTGIKNTHELSIIRRLAADQNFPLSGRRVLILSAMDRGGMARGFVEADCEILCGDLIFAIKADQPIYDLAELETLAETLLPEVAAEMPIGELYRIGKEQDKPPDTSLGHWFKDYDVIAGDYHFIGGYMPDDLSGKVVITNTTTPADVEALRQRGVSFLVTTTPVFNGRSFGTNVIEAVVGLLTGKPFSEIDPAVDYPPILERLDLQPSIRRLN